MRTWEGAGVRRKQRPAMATAALAVWVTRQLPPGPRSASRIGESDGQINRKRIR